MTRHDDNSPLNERAQQAIRDGEAAWVRISSGEWDISAWQVMGAALTLLRQQTLHELGTSVARGSIYNKAFADRVSATKFATMDTVTRSNLLFLMEPEIRVVLDRLLTSWTPAIRAKRTHPTTLAQYVRKELKPKPTPTPKPTQPAPSSSEIERLRKRVTELEAAAKAAPSSPAQAEAAVPFQDLSKLSRERLEREVFKARFESDRLRSLLAETRKSEPEQIAALRRVIGELQQAHVRRDRAAKAQQTRTAKVALDPDSEAARQIKVLQRRVHSLNEQLKRKDHSDVAVLANGAPFTVRTKIAKALYEQSTDAPSRLAALQAWNALGANKGGDRKR